MAALHGPLTRGTAPTHVTRKREHIMITLAVFDMAGTTIDDRDEVYRVLRMLNPSPYLYLLSLEDAAGAPYAVVGSSPEALVTVHDGAAIVIARRSAGWTRPSAPRAAPSPSPPGAGGCTW